MQNLDSPEGNMKTFKKKCHVFYIIKEFSFMYYFYSVFNLVEEKNQLVLLQCSFAHPQIGLHIVERFGYIEYYLKMSSDAQMGAKKS